MNAVKQAYKRHTASIEGMNSFNRFKETFYGTPDSLVTRIGGILQARYSPGTSLRTLDIGGGDGARLYALQELLEAKDITLEPSIVDPSLATARLLRPVIGGRPWKVRAYTVPFEQANLPGKFDLQLMLHSYFTFENPRYAYKLARHLTPEGLLFIAGNDPNSFLGTLKGITDAELGQRREIDDVLKDLEGYGFTYDVTESVTSVPGLIDDRGLTDAGEDVLSWIAMRPFEEIDPHVLELATKHFQDSAEDGVIPEKEVFVLAHL